MENKTFKEWLMKQPNWIKALVITAMLIAVAFGSASCTAKMYMERRGFHQDSIYQYIKINPKKAEIM